jgi:hypothetical protein
MKVKVIGVISLICLLFVFSSRVKAQSYSKLWSDVKTSVSKDLPKSALSTCDRIIRKAEKEKNVGQLMLASFYRNKMNEEISPDSLYTQVKDLENWCATAPNKVEQAMLHSILAGIYTNYASMNEWELRRRTNVVKKTSDDIREWTRVQFFETVTKHLDASMTDIELLHRTLSNDYIPFVKLGWASKFYNNDMLHLIVKKNLDVLNELNDIAYNQKEIKSRTESLYRTLVDTYTAAGQKDGIVLASLDRIEEQYGNGRDNKKYISSLDSLLTQYNGSPVLCEVYLAKVEYLSSHHKYVEALRLCDEAIQRYPNYERISTLKEQRNEILQPSLSLNFKDVAYPKSEMTIKASSNNVDGFDLLIYRIPEGMPINDKLKAENCKLISDTHYDIVRTKDYSEKTDSFRIVTPDIGIYLLKLRCNRTITEDNNILRVSRLKILTMGVDNGTTEVVVVDRLTGKPIEKAEVSSYDWNNRPIASKFTNAEGKTTFAKNQRNNLLKATKGDDKYLDTYRGNSYFASYSSHPMEVRLMLFTDRSIYRPGQTVYVKGIAYAQQGDSTRVTPNSKSTLSLRDVNYQEVGSKQVTTNEYGSFNTSFVLPSSCLNGIFSIRTSRGSVSFRVEEYKRPTFEVTTDEVKESYSIGDSINVKGKAMTFSGIPLDGQKVTYTVRREKWEGWWQHSSEIINTDSVKTAADGSFIIPVLLAGDQASENNDDIDNDVDTSYRGFLRYYHYTIHVDVTDAAGETQSGELAVAAGKRSLILKRSSEEKLLCKDKTISETFSAMNLLHKLVDTPVTYTLSPMKDGKAGSTADKGTATSNKEVTLDHWRQLPSGAYRLTLTAKDSQGREVKEEENITLFNVTDKHPVDNSDIWSYSESKKDVFDEQHPAKFYFGTSRKDATVMMDVFANGRRIESKLLTFSNEIRAFEYSYKKAYGDGITVNFCFVKDERMFQTNFSFQKTLPDRNLLMKWSVFRDKLRPGQKETWTLSVLQPNGRPANAEMMAYLYDASLDKLNNHPFAPQVSFSRFLTSSNWIEAYLSDSRLQYSQALPNVVVKSLEFNRFTDEDDLFNLYEGRGGVRSRVLFAAPRVQYELADSKAFVSMNAIKGNANMVAAKEVAVAKSANRVDGAMDEAVVVGDGTHTNAEKSEPALRSNFAETAFFYPQLHTDAKGNVNITFTLPESLTRWKFNGFAHTKEMLNGILKGETTASKEFMLTPFLPRFVRTGDHTSISATLSNRTGKALNTNVKMELFDPATDEVILTQTKPVSLAGNENAAAAFDFTVTDRYDILGVRMVAESGTFSDGEQHLLPVLSDKVMLTESVPLPIRGNQTRTFSLEKLFNGHSATATHRRLTVEYTGNPAWYAVQALPSLSLPESDNAISWATALYANSLASYIANSMPRIKSIIESWKAGGGNKESLLSNLQKNQELKNILLSESPWVLEAKSEQEQKERLGTLFDLNSLSNMQTSAISKLQQLQNSDGAWTWFKGMPGSWCITEYVTRLLARLNLLTGSTPNARVAAMQSRGLAFLHSESQKEYELLRKAEKEGQKIKGVSYSTLRYLYLIAITGEKVPAKYQTAYNYFLAKVNEVPASQDMQEKSLAAIVLAKAGKKAAANEYMQSLREHLTQTDELGMFFDFNDNPFSWGRMHLTAHTAAIEAFDKVANDTKTVDEMNIWLLKQKQTQMWDTPVSTADAIYALLERGTDVLSNKGEVQLTLGGQTLSTTDKGAISGLNYIKKCFDDAPTTDARSITVQKKDDGIAWGAVYATFSEAIANVKQQGSQSFNVKKDMFVKHIVNNVPQLDAIRDKASIHVGDIVVARLIIQLDRRMDFVQLKEQRGACFEPLTALSGYHWGAGTGYYEEIKDASTNFFFDSLDKGVYVLEISYRASRKGNYEVGLSTLQCAYAPEFATHSDSMRIEVLP